MRFFLTAVLALLLIACHSDKANNVVEAKDSSSTALLPLADVSNNQIQLLARELQLFYGMKVGVLPRKAMPENSRLKNTRRYSAPVMLQLLKKQKPANYDRILGVTTCDIYTRKGPYPHWGIFGLGYKPGEACIVSEYRLKQFGAKTDTFLTLVTLHEIGHNLGLPHCARHPSCLMNDAKGTARTLFAEKKWLCSNCRSLLKKS